MRGWEPTPQDIRNLEAAGATLRYVEAPIHYTRPPPGSDVPFIRVDKTTWTPSPDWGAIQYEHEHSSDDDGKEVEISVPYEDEEGNAKTVTITYTYEHVQASKTIGSQGVLYVRDSVGVTKLSTGGVSQGAFTAISDAVIAIGGHDGYAYIGTTGDDVYRVDADGNTTIVTSGVTATWLIGVDASGVLYFMESSSTLHKYGSDGNWVETIIKRPLFAGGVGSIDAAGNIYTLYTPPGAGDYYLRKFDVNGDFSTETLCLQIANWESESANTTGVVVDFDGNAFAGVEHDGHHGAFVTSEGVASWASTFAPYTGCAGGGFFYFVDGE